MSCVATSICRSCTALLAALSLGIFAAPGQLDPTFGSSGSVFPIDFGANTTFATFGGLLPLADGSIITATDCKVGAPADGRISICLQRLNAGGQLDTTFGTSGVASAAFPWGSSGYYFSAQNETHLIQQADGKFLAANPCSGGFAPALCIARFSGDGILDPTFNSGGTLPGVQSLVDFVVGGVIGLQSSGKIVIGGACAQTFCVTRLNANGTLDTSFASAASGTGRSMPFETAGAFPHVTASVNALKIDASDRIVVVGTCYVSSFDTRYPCVGRLSPNGATDPTFANANTSAPVYGSWFPVATFGNYATGNDVAIQTDGKILFIGDCGDSPATATCLVRLLSSGTPDSSFTSASSGLPGIVKLDAPDGFKASRSIKIQSDDKIVFAGECSSIFSLFCVGRLNADGSIDTTYDASPGNGNGIVQLTIGPGAGYAADVALTASGKIIVYGSCRQTNGIYTGCAARLLGGARDTAACSLNVDANNTIDPATDAQLIVRYVLGYRGNALTNGVLGANPTRTGAPLEAHLASLNLDADGDGQVHAMTDGLLILRAMLGLSGNALTAGAVNTSSPTVRNAQQILTWIESTHGVACLP